MSYALSAIVVNYNAGSLLGRCIQALLACPLDIEIIVIDNASTDDSLRHVPESDQIRIIQSSVNRGFAAACNIGIAQATAPYFLFLNPDCYCQGTAVVTLLDYLQSDPQVGMVGGLLLNLDGTEQAGGRRAVPTPWRSFVRAFGLQRYAHRWPKLFFDFHLHRQPLPSAPIEVEAISGACMLVKRDVVDHVGLWDEGYFLHCEDLDWCMRFRRAGWKIMFVPNARFTHEQGGCSNAFPVFVEWHKHKGMVRFYRKFFRHQYPTVLMILVIFGVWLRFGVVATLKLARKLRERY